MKPTRKVSQSRPQTRKRQAEEEAFAAAALSAKFFRECSAMCPNNDVIIPAKVKQEVVIKEEVPEGFECEDEFERIFRDLCLAADEDDYENCESNSKEIHDDPTNRTNALKLSLKHQQLLGNKTLVIKLNSKECESFLLQLQNRTGTLSGTSSNEDISDTGINKVVSYKYPNLDILLNLRKDCKTWKQAAGERRRTRFFLLWSQIYLLFFICWFPVVL